MWKTLTPELPVADVAETQAYYRDVLGFQVSFTHGESFGGVHYEGAEIFLAKADAPWAAACCCVRVEDADALHAIYRERGVRIVEPIANRPWGMREFTIEEPNGHRFRIGHSTRHSGLSAG